MRSPEGRTPFILATAVCVGIGAPLVASCGAEQAPAPPPVMPSSQSRVAQNCDGVLSKASHLGERHDYQLYEPTDSQNGPCIPITGQATHAELAKIIAYPAESAKASPFFACKAKGVLWAAGIELVGHGTLDFEQATPWGHMATAPEVFMQIADCPKGFNPRVAVNHCTVPQKAAISAADPRCTP